MMLRAAEVPEVVELRKTKKPLPPFQNTFIVDGFAYMPPSSCKCPVLPSPVQSCASPRRPELPRHTASFSRPQSWFFGFRFLAVSCEEAQRPWIFPRRRAIFVSARVHPGETPASFMLEGPRVYASLPSIVTAVILGNPMRLKKKIPGNKEAVARFKDRCVGLPQIS